MSGPPPLRSSPPPLQIAHKARISVFEKEKTWAIVGKALHITEPGQPGILIPLDTISKVRLVYVPTRFQTNRFRCLIYRRGIKIAMIQNDHFKSVANFEDRSSSYSTLIHALVSRVASLNPSCEFAAGISFFRWTANIIFLSVTFAFLLLALIFLYTAIGWLVVVKLLIIAWFTPTAVRWFIRNKPSQFSPAKIPANLLPETAWEFPGSGTKISRTGHQNGISSSSWKSSIGAGDAPCLGEEDCAEPPPPLS